MSNGFECLNCTHLGRCAETNEEKLKTQYHCPRWQGAITELVNARNKLISAFGDAAFKTLIKTDIKEG